MAKTSYDINETFSRVLNDIETQQRDTDEIKSGTDKKTEYDCLLMAFMYLLKAYMQKTSTDNGQKPPVYPVGA